VHIREIQCKRLEMRIKQEIVLGVGGARALHLLGLWPFVYHLNEGHAAFAALERIRQTMNTYKTSFEVAMEAVTASTVFTTHTPVPAGIDLFPQDLIDKYFRKYMESMGMTVKDLLNLGCANPDDRITSFHGRFGPEAFTWCERSQQITSRCF